MIDHHSVHLWFARPESIVDSELLARYHSLLNEEEAVQQKRFHFQRHRHQYLITRALIRTTLSRYIPEVPPADWRFEKNKYGRPNIASDLNLPPLKFNLSHTDGLIACAVGLGREIGVDVENMERGGELIPIADRFFSVSEVADLHRVPETKQDDRFFDYWTLKESYIKARGMGLSIPLGEFSFHLMTEGQVSLTLDPKQDDNACRWLFRQWRQDAFKIALTVDRLQDQKVELQLRQVVPMEGDRAFDCNLLRGNF